MSDGGLSGALVRSATGDAYSVELTRLEGELERNMAALDDCTHLYLGMSWSDYKDRVGYLNSYKLHIPNGMMDAKEFLEYVHKKEEEIELHKDVNPGMVVTLRDGIYHLMSAVTIIDTESFRAEASGLLNQRIDIFLAHRKHIAERIVALRTGPADGR